MATFDSQLQCSIGTSSFQLADWSMSNLPAEDAGRIFGRDIAIEGEGWVDGTSAADLASKVAAVAASFAGLRPNITISDNGQVMVNLAAAACLGGGPHVGWRILPQKDGTALCKRFAFSVTARTGLPVGGGPADGDSRRLKVSTRPDGLRVATYTGEIRRVAALAEFDALVAQWDAQHPWMAWVRKTRESDINYAGDVLTYTVSYEELAEPLSENAAVRWVDGTYSYRKDRDERWRMLITETWDLLVIGDPMAVGPMIRPDGTRLVRESFEVSGIREFRVRASYTRLDSAQADDLLDWQCDVDGDLESAPGRAVQFDGLAAALVSEYSSISRLTISGRAVGLNRWPKPPGVPTIAGYVLSERPRVRRATINEYERETSWMFSFVGTGAVPPTLIAEMGRPDRPEFY